MKQNILKTVLTTVLCFLTTYSIFGEDYFTALIGREQYNKLLTEGEVTSVFITGENLKIAPQTKGNAALLAEVSATKPVIGVEMLLLYKEPGRVFDNDAGRLKIYNRLHAISTLAGIEYYSITRKRIRTFFYQAYAIDSATAKQKVADPVAAAIPAADDLRVFLEDSTFGKYNGQVKYSYTDNCFTMDIANESKIWYMLMPAVAPGHLKIYIAIFPYQDTILFYGFTCVNTINLFNVAETRVPSFTNRIKAMFAWFKAGVM